MSAGFFHRLFGNRAFLAAAAALWVGTLVLAGRVLVQYEATPGIDGTPPSDWPAASAIRPAPGRFTLVMMAHPDCPCSRASLAELDALLTRAGEKPAVFAVFSKPGATAADIEASELWKSAKAIPGVIPLADIEGVEAARFGAQVSGQTMLYDRQGRLAFRGGITGARGHPGDNQGRAAVLAILQGEALRATRAAVFGCSLRNPSDQTLAEEPAWTKK
jgi:hypothetical protein